jgi:hypothetical protein
MSLLEVLCDINDFMLSACSRAGKATDCERARNERVQVNSSQVR